MTVNWFFFGSGVLQLLAVPFGVVQGQQAVVLVAYGFIALANLCFSLVQ